jgi:glycosyltransferase involved in cell wall biosynthesis
VAGRLADAGVAPEKVAVVYDGVPIDPKAPLGSALLSPRWENDPRKPRALAQQAASLAGVPLQFAGDLKADLPNAQALLYVTDMEGLGSGALLAMSAGVPVIASRVGGLPEIVHDMVNGLLVDNEPNSLADAIRRLMTDRPLAERLGSNGREMVKEHFTLAHMALRTLHEYKKVLA